MREQLLRHKQSVNVMYLITYAVCYMYMFLNTTMFGNQGLDLFCGACIALDGMIVLYRLATMKKSEWPKLLLMIFMVTIFGVYFILSKRKKYLLFLTLILAGKDVDFRRIVKTSVVVGTFITIVTIVGSKIGLVENLTYMNGLSHYRQSLGFIYPTDFAAHVFFLVLGYCFLRDGQLKKYEYLGLIVLTLIIYKTTYARNDVLGLIILILSTKVYQSYILKRDKKTLHRKRPHKLLNLLMISLAFIAIVGIIYATFNYHDIKLNQYFHTIVARLSMGRLAFEKYGINLFGVEFTEVGFGGTEEMPSSYFFIDSSYVSSLIRNGILVFSLYVILHFVCLYRASAISIYHAGIIALITINCIMEHHWTDIGYNYFWLLGFTSLSSHYKRRSIRFVWRSAHTRGLKMKQNVAAKGHTM